MLFESADAKGRFEITELPPVRVEVEVSADGFRDAQEVLMPGSGEIVIRLQKQSAEVAARLEAIDKELQSIYGQFATAKDDEARKALGSRLQALNREKQELTEGR